jgi:hypothetical protein
LVRSVRTDADASPSQPTRTNRSITASESNTSPESANPTRSPKAASREHANNNAFARPGEGGATRATVSRANPAAPADTERGA